MKLSIRTRHGVRALLDLALQGNEGPIRLREIAQRQQISLLYLEHLIAPLIASGIMRSTRGARGGVWLAKSPLEIKLSEVIRLLQGSIVLVKCIDNPETCPRSDSCVTRDVWAELEGIINRVLGSITLQDLVNRYREREHSGEIIYHGKSLLSILKEGNR